MKQPEIKAGQVWKMRNGKQIKIDEIMPQNGKTPVRSGTLHWMENGKYWALNYNHSKDLIQLIS